MRTLLGTTVIGLVLAAPAFANDSQIEQIGGSNTATVTQTAGTGGNATVRQTGADDVASVTQSDGGGSGTNTSLVQQLGGSGTQTATVTQNNAGNGPANSAEILQESTQGGNSAAINQNGKGNTALAQQGPGEAKNCYTPYGCSGTTPLDITNSMASVDQIGNSNTANTYQVVGSNGGDNNIATVEQMGDQQEATIRQGTGAVASIWYVPNPASNDNDNSASINQYGFGHAASIEQGGESGYAVSTQTGQDNGSTIVQSGGVPGIGNAATVMQTGNGNNSTVAQTSDHGDRPLFPGGATAIVTQTGDNNDSNILQAPLGGHLATVIQNGNDHSSLIEQDGLVNNSSVTQSLTGQTSEIFQTGPSAVGPIGNIAIVSQQVTANNVSAISQSGVGNVSSVLQ